jgi:uncharacterized protein (DUF2267 family)
MKYRELIKKVQEYSGFSDAESQDALQLLIEILAVQLPERIRREFASQLPEELEDVALSTWATEEHSSQEILEQSMDLQGIDERHAVKQIKTAWAALEDSLSDHEIEDIKSQLPSDTASLLA